MHCSGALQSIKDEYRAVSGSSREVPLSSRLAGRELAPNEAVVDVMAFEGEDARVISQLFLLIAQWVHLGGVIELGSWSELDLSDVIIRQHLPQVPNFEQLILAIRC